MYNVHGESIYCIALQCTNIKILKNSRLPSVDHIASNCTTTIGDQNVSVDRSRLSIMYRLFRHSTNELLFRNSLHIRIAC